jgi:hypothetical protein
MFLMGFFSWKKRKKKMKANRVLAIRLLGDAHQVRTKLQCHGDHAP